MKNIDLKKIIVSKIHNKGGWVNVHSHLDRAFTLHIKNINYIHATLKEKWTLNDELKRKSTVNQIYDRMCKGIESILSQNVQAIGSFIDVDEVIKDKAIKAADKVRTKYKKHIRIKYINQTLKGVLEREAYEWFRYGAEFVDIIGGLPGRDEGRESQHLDVILQEAKRLHKRVHVHVDQLNTVKEKETELLAQKTIEHNMIGKVSAIHCISLSAQPQKYRKKIYSLLKKAHISVITCPTAWIDSRRSEEKSVTHNSIAPVEELMQHGIDVSIGTDNINDIYKPFTDGDMWTELRFLLESCHYYEIDDLVKISTHNGLKALGI